MRAVLRRSLPLICAWGIADAAQAVLHSVPSQHATIQAAIDAAASGDVIEVAPGVYAQTLTISSKSLTIRSRFTTSGDPEDIEATVIQGSSGADAITLAGSASLLLQGVSLRTGSAAVRVNMGCLLELTDGRVRSTSDGISLEGGTGAADPIARAVIRRSVLESNSDDAVDSDGKSELWIEDSEIRGNGDEAVEIRLQPNGFAPGQSITHVFLRNRFTGNGEDGVQLIDYDATTPRSFRFERNVFADNVKAGLGISCDGNTVESFEACPMPESVHLVNNSFVGNDHGLSGGANLIGVNNLFAANTTLGAKNVAGASLLAQSLFFDNGTHHTGSNVDAGSTLIADPLLTGSLLLQDGSPAIDAGTAFYSVGSEVILDLEPGEYGGAAPDLGAYEWIPGTGPDALSIEVQVAAGSDDAEQGGSTVSLANSDLELGMDGAIAQTVGIRFQNVALPPLAPITAAWIQFRADETGSSASALTIEGQAADDPPTFSSTANDVSSRPRTLASASWSPPAWTAVGRAGPAEQTSDLSGVVQELVDRPGWASGNAMVFLFTGSGTRTADPYEGDASAAPLLYVEYVEPGCGNGFLEDGESCDDGNLAPGDGCDASCQLSSACSDGVDNDTDTYADFPLDPGCASASDAAERSPSLPCDDGVDNDGDGGIDSAGDEDFDGLPDSPGDLACPGPGSPREDPECQNGVDDDGQSGIDFDGGASLNGGAPIAAADPHCDWPYDDDESHQILGPAGCGLGPELLGLAVLLACRRFRRAGHASNA